MDLALFVLRVVVGAFFVGHGTQKLLGWFGGGGPAQTARFFESLGLRPGWLHARAAGAAEAAGGLLLMLGLFTPLAATLIIAVMVAAIVTVHGPRGPWVSDGGYEYNLVLCAAAFALAGVGPGDWSFDTALGVDLAGAGWALGALACGLLGAAATLVSSPGVQQPDHSAAPPRPSS